MRNVLIFLLMILSQATYSVAQETEANHSKRDVSETIDSDELGYYEELGYRMAFMGDRKKSSMMMLAAAELLGGLQAGEGIEIANKELLNSEGRESALDMSFSAILDGAVEYADEDSKKLVEARVAGLRSGKGVAWQQRNTPSSGKVEVVFSGYGDATATKPQYAYDWAKTEAENDARKKARRAGYRVVSWQEGVFYHRGVNGKTRYWGHMKGRAVLIKRR